MKLQEIKDAVEAGKRVCYHSKFTEVRKDNLGQWLIFDTTNEYCIGLTHQDEVTMNGNEEDFFTEYMVVYSPSGSIVQDGFTSEKEAYAWLEKASEDGTLDLRHISEYAVEVVKET